MLLRRPLTLSMLALMAIALSASLALVALTTRLHSKTRDVAAAARSVATAEEALIDLRALEGLAASTAASDEHSRAAASPRATALLERVRALEARVHDAEERAALQEVERAVSRYVDAIVPSSALESTVGDVEIRSAAFESARTALRRFVELESARGRSVVASAGRLDRTADRWGFGVAALALFGTATVLWLMERRLFGPLLAIGRSISRYGDEPRGLRAPEVGAAETRLVARKFNELARRIERQKDDQLAFLAGLAHDLRNPLSAMRLATRSLTVNGADPERVGSKVGVLERQIDRLERLASDFLDAARAEAGQLRLSVEENDLRELASAVADLYGGTSAHPIELVAPDEPLVAHCDAARVEQVVSNLVTNAIKYSPGDTPVRVAVCRRGDDAVVEVTDSGVGIPLDELREIFEPFRRGKRVPNAIPGLGIGLATSRRIAELHGGRLTVASIPGKGSTFALELPLGRGARLRPTAPDAPAGR